MTGLPSKRRALKADVKGPEKQAVCRRVLASEILQAGAVKGLRTGTGEGYGGGGEREIIYLSLHCHHQSDFCIKMGSDESHFNVS